MRFSFLLLAGLFLFQPTPGPAPGGWKRTAAEIS